MLDISQMPKLSRDQGIATVRKNLSSRRGGGGKSVETERYSENRPFPIYNIIKGDKKKN
jgi:hypothetical protein